MKSDRVIKMQMLKTVVEDQLAWDGNLDWNEQILELPHGAQKELISAKTILDPMDPAGVVKKLLENGRLNEFTRFIESVKTRIDGAPGFVAIDLGEDMPREYYDLSIVAASLTLGNHLEEQDASRIKLKEVKDRGLRYGQEGVKYSETNKGGNLHVDGAEWPGRLPDYLAFLIIRQGKSGGDTLMASAYALHNWFLKNDQDSLKVLYQDFSWDRRGKLGPNGEETFQAPVFSYDPGTGRLIIRYLRQYIDDGHRKSGAALNDAQLKALSQMDTLLSEDSPLVLKGRIPPGHLSISNNPETIHGRNDFEDFLKDGMPDPEKCRLGIRTWVFRKN